MPEKGRVFFPANSVDTQFYAVDVNNSKDRSGNVSFRINVKEGRKFQKLQYKLGRESWKGFLPRDISANLYIVRLESNEMERLSLRLSTGDKPIVLTSVSIQHSIGVELFQPEQGSININMDISVINNTFIDVKLDSLVKQLSISNQFTLDINTTS